MNAAGGHKLVGLNPYQVNVLKDKLTFENPAFAKAVELGQPTQGIAEVIRGYKEHQSRLVVPRYFRDFPEGQVETPRHLKAVEFVKTLTTSPRDTQLEVVSTLNYSFPRDIGLSLPCGFGKTFLALYYAEMFRGRVLVVCPTNVKMEEWQKEVQKHLGIPKEEVGRVQASVRDWKDKAVTLTMLKTLATQDFPDDFLNGFDLVIWDEAHLCGAPVLSQALGRVNGTNLTLTATPGRGVRRRLIELHNGSNWVTDFGGEKVPVSAYFMEIPVSDYIKSLDWRFQKIRLSKTRAYSDFAVKHVDSAIDAGRRVLVLNSQIQPLAYMHSQFNNAGFVVGSGSLKDIAKQELDALYPEAKSWKAKTSKYLERVKAACNPILATGLTKTQPGGVGMDVSDLDAGVVMFPVSCPDMTQQLVGRWQRRHKDKKDPIIIIMVPNTPIAKAIAKKMESKLVSLGITTYNRRET